MSEASEVIGFRFDSKEPRPISRHTLQDTISIGIGGVISQAEAQAERLGFERIKGEIKTKSHPNKAEIEGLQRRGYILGLLNMGEQRRNAQIIAVNPQDKSILLYDPKKRFFTNGNSYLNQKLQEYLKGEVDLFADII